MDSPTELRHPTTERFISQKRDLSLASPRNTVIATTARKAVLDMEVGLDVLKEAGQEDSRNGHTSVAIARVLAVVEPSDEKLNPTLTG